MIGMSFHYLQRDPSGILIGKPIAEYGWYRLAFTCHVGFGLLAITLGPWQLIRKVRQRYPRLHRQLGYVYAIGVASSSLAGLIIAPYAMGGWVAQWGFGCLAVCWFGSLGKGIWSARTGDLESHRTWMTINYALTFAAITQRTLLLLPLLTDVPFLPVYQVSAWLPWLLNASIALLYLSKNPMNSALTYS